MDTSELIQHPYLATICRWFLAVLFLVAGVRKLTDRNRFVQTVSSYQILPDFATRGFAFFVVWLEIVIGTALLLGVGVVLALIVGGILIISFSVAVGVNLARGRTELDCGCFGAQHKENIGFKTLIRNFMILFLFTYTSFIYKGYASVDGILFPQYYYAEQASTPISGLILILLIILGVWAMIITGRQAWSLVNVQSRS